MEVFKSTIAYVEYGHANAKAITGLPFIGSTTSGSGYALGVIYLF
jgi:hypothetical protein